MKPKLVFAVPLVLIFFSGISLAREEGERPGGDKSGRRGPPQFSVVDLDTDGTLTLEEFQSQDIPRGDHSEIFALIDADGDGLVTETEWTSHKPPKRGGREDRD